MAKHARRGRPSKPAQAETLDDLSQEALTAWRQVEDAGTLKSAGTRRAYYGRVKTIISFGLKCGMGQQQIRAHVLESLRHDQSLVLLLNRVAPSVLVDMQQH